MQQDQEVLSFDQVLGVVRRRVPLILGCMILVAGAAYGYSKHETKKYTATASLEFSYDSLSQEIAGLPVVSSSSLTAQQASNREQVKLGTMAIQTAALLGHGLTAQKVAGDVSIASPEESNVVDVAATATSPTLAAAIANTYVSQFIKEQQNANRKYFQSALAVVHKQLATMSPQQRLGGDGVQLVDRAQTLSLLSELGYGDAQLAGEALPPASASSPKTSRNTVLGLFVGLLVGLILAFVRERLDRRIQRPEDLEAIYRLPPLGAVPKSAALSRATRGGGGRSALPPVEAEAFSLIRAHLRFFNVGRNLRTVLIASAAQGDGKTTVAHHLAEAASRSGSRVLLLEVDLRQPKLARQLGVKAGPGLADVLIGAPIRDTIQSIGLEMSSTDPVHAHRLDVLVAGAVLPPNPAELLESSAMDTVLQWARTSYDLVVIDTPPLTAVSDAFPLLTKVDGVVIVGWIGRSRREAAKQLHQALASCGAPLLGVVANGSTVGGPSVYATPSQGAPPPTPQSAGASASEPTLTVKV